MGLKFLPTFFSAPSQTAIDAMTTVWLTSRRVQTSCRNISRQDLPHRRLFIQRQFNISCRIGFTYPAFE
jgi:hypothetical protein